MSSFDRPEAIERLTADQFDVVVVGGGITGAGVALDAASRGLRTALVERRDFASGTSSRSSKFVHGGLRYLHQRQFRLVAESLVEQRRLLRNAPHLVRPLPVLLPTPAGLRKVATAALLAVHDAIGGGGRSRTTADGVVFHEAQVDDARLTLAVIRTAVLDHGAVAANYCPVAGIEAGAVHLENGARIATRATVNATGVWSSSVAAGPAIRPAKGIHLVVERSKIPFPTAVVLRLAGENRWVFAAPWEGWVEIGTTDTDYDGPLDEPVATDEDIAGLLDSINRFLPDPLVPADVRSAWAGLRPLVGPAAGGNTADLSRRHRVEAGPHNTVTVVGGKLTTYRQMAADTVDAVLDVLGEPHRPSGTARLPLHGAAPMDPAAPPHLWHRYGTDWRAVAATGAADALVHGLPYTEAEAVYAIRHEMAVTVDDILSRRTRATFLDRPAADVAVPTVAALLASEATERR